MANKNYSVSELKKRAQRRKMLVLRMEGLRDEAKHWDKYISTTERKRKATKAIKTAAEIAELAAGVPAVGKAIGKKVVKKGLERASRVKVTPDSRLAKRTADAALKEIKEKAAKRRGVLVEKTTVKGGKATTPKLPKGAGGSKPRRSLPRSQNKPAGDAGKRVAKREKYYKERQARKIIAEKAKKKEKFLEGSGAPKTSAKAKSKKISNKQAETKAKRVAKKKEADRKKPKPRGGEWVGGWNPAGYSGF